MPENEILKVDGLNVSYGRSQVLFGVTLGVSRNELVSVVGRNGAGKTTLLKTIGGFLRPTKGSISFKEHNTLGIRAFNLVKLGLRYVPQDKIVFSDLTVRENLELASYATRDRNWDRVYDYFPKLRELLDRKGAHLSGGERQMVMIARALFGSPELLLIDEPTEGLAPSIVNDLRDSFIRLSREATLIIVEQNLTIVAEMSDRVFAMKEGKIAAVVEDRKDIQSMVYEQHL